LDHRTNKPPPRTGRRVGLSIDWDFFMSWTPLYAEYTKFHMTTAWSFRSRPTLHPSHETLGPFLFQKMSPRVRVTENHVEAYRYFRDFDHVLHLDRHTDRYPLDRFPGHLTCGNWAGHLQDEGTWIEHISHPIHLDYDYLRSLSFESTYICRSSPWTHPDYDRQFNEFVKSVGGHSLRPRRGWKKSAKRAIEEVVRETDWLSLTDHWERLR